MKAFPYSNKKAVMDLDDHPPGGGQPLQEGQVGFLALVLPVERKGVGIVEQFKPVALQTNY